jgi:Prokaryotic phospholipase A2
VASAPATPISALRRDMANLLLGIEWTTRGRILTAGVATGLRCGATAPQRHRNGHGDSGPARDPNKMRGEGMSRRVIGAALAVVAATVLALLVPTGPADATVSHSLRMARMWGWTQTERSSYDSWVVGLNHQERWVEYDFDWSTDYCSSSPDQPLGFDFRMPCRRHDFGYRNYKLLGAFNANKSRVDRAFLQGMLRKCATYNVFVRPACVGVAGTYYEAVVNFGDLAVSPSDLDQFAAMKAEAEAQAVGAR